MLKNDLRVTLFDKDEQVQYIWEVKQIGQRSRFFDTLLSHLKEFENGRLEIKILNESR